MSGRISLDWADRKHDICLRAADSEKVEHQVLVHSPEAIDAWARELRGRFGGRPVGVCLELVRGPIVSALQKYDFFVLFPINPKSLASYRQAWSPSGAKDDPSDAALALDVLTKHRERLTPLRPQSPQMRALQQLVEDRRKLVNDRVRVTNRLTVALKRYYPQPLQWFDDKGTEVFCDFLQRWPDILSARRARRQTLEGFFKKHRVRKHITQQRIESIRAALPLTEDQGVVLPARLAVQALVQQLRPLLSSIAAYDKQIKELSESMADYTIFRSLPGAADTLAPRLMAAFGEDRERYQSAAELQRYSGIAPVTERSGDSTWVHFRYRCPTFIRQGFVEWAGQTIPRSYWAEAFYKQQRAKGMRHQAALRALAFKWLRILYRCWKDRTAYDEAAYLKALKKRGSPLLKNAASG